MKEDKLIEMMNTAKNAHSPRLETRQTASNVTSERVERLPKQQSEILSNEEGMQTG
jgi:hypothetical protein